MIIITSIPKEKKRKKKTHTHTHTQRGFHARTSHQTRKTGNECANLHGHNPDEDWGQDVAPDDCHWYQYYWCNPTKRVGVPARRLGVVVQEVVGRVPSAAVHGKVHHLVPRIQSLRESNRKKEEAIITREEGKKQKKELIIATQIFHTREQHQKHGSTQQIEARVSDLDGLDGEHGACEGPEVEWVLINTNKVGIRWWSGEEVYTE
jgi:hypothetical protein